MTPAAEVVVGVGPRAAAAALGASVRGAATPGGGAVMWTRERETEEQRHLSVPLSPSARERKKGPGV